MSTTHLDTVKIKLDRKNGTSLTARLDSNIGSTIHLGATPLGWVKISSEVIKESIRTSNIDDFLTEAFQEEDVAYEEALLKVKSRRNLYKGNYEWMEVSSSSISYITKPQSTLLENIDYLEFTKEGVQNLLMKAIEVLSKESEYKLGTLESQLLLDSLYRMEFKDDLESLLFYRSLIRSKTRLKTNAIH